MSRASRSSSRDRLTLLALLAGLGMGSLAARADDAATGFGFDDAELVADAAGGVRRAPRARELVVAVVVNGEPAGDAVVLQDSTLGLLVERDDTAHWRIAVPEEKELRAGVEYVVLGEVPGVTYTLDPKKLVLAVKVDAGQFVREDRALYDLKIPQTMAPTPGLFANYAFAAREAPLGSSQDGYLQLGFFAGWNVLTSDWQYLDTDTTLADVTRLNTTLTHDFPERVATLRLGDFTTPNSSFGQGPQIGGVQWATNFNTRPGLMPIPLQRLQGQVSVPSVVEVFVNGSPVYRTEVAPGPFIISDIPVVTGTGTVEMVITDASGKRQVVTNPFYASPSVLRRGLHEYSYQAGAQRVLATNGVTLEYGDPVAVATHRWGVTDAFTLELHGEWSDAGSQLGAATAFLAPGGGVVRFGLAGSEVPAVGNGGFGLLSYERVFRKFSFAVETLHATKEYAQMGGLQPDPAHSREQSRASFGYSGPSFGSLSLAVQHQRNITPNSKSTSSTATWTHALGRWASLSLSLSHEQPSQDVGAFMSLTMPFGTQTTFSVSESAQRDAASGITTTDTLATLQRAPGSGPGWGYRLSAGQGGQQLGELTLQNEVGELRASSQTVANGYANAISVAGGLATAGTSVHFSRLLGDGFALVRVPGMEDVGVFMNNNYVGSTDGDGELLVTQLPPYQETRIALDATDVPLDSQLKVDQMKAVPRYRALAKLEFPADTTRGYIAALVRRDGKPLPAGAVYTVDGGAELEPVGTAGMIYLTLDPGEHTLDATWADQRCTARVKVEAGADPMPDLGKLRCEEAR